MEKITVTRALTTLKLMDKKINKAIRNGCFVTYKIGDKIDQECDSKGNFQSVKDLINHRNNIKYAIIDSNAKTKVQIAGTEYTVQEAIEAKNNIKYKETLLKTLKSEHQRVTRDVDEINESVMYRLDKLIESSLGNDSKNSDVDAISKPFLKRNEAVIVDDIKILDVIKNLEDEIDNFLNEVDLSLNEINSQTYIEV